MSDQDATAPGRPPAGLPSPATEARQDDHEPGNSKRPLIRRVITAAIVILLVLEIVLLIPHLRGTGQALAHLHVRWIVVAIFAEVSSMVYFARLQRRMLRAGGIRVPLRRAVATALAANAVSVTLPAGPVLSSGYTFRRMRAWGASAPLATWGMFSSGALSTVALAVVGIFGSGLASGHRPNPLVVGGEVVVAFAVVYSLRRLVGHPEQLMSVGQYSLTHVNKLLHKPPQTGRTRLRDLVDELTLIRPRARDWLLGLNFAILNWIADLVCLIAACRAVGAHGPSLAVAFVAYAAGMAASSLPLLPGGLGIVDATLVLALTRGGLPASVATAGVLVYRAISFILVAAVGWVAFAAIRRGDRRRPAALADASQVEEPQAEASSN